MSEVKHIAEILAEMVKTDKSTEAELIKRCPMLQRELLRQGLINLEDLTSEQIDTLMNIVFQEERMPIDNTDYNIKR